MNPSRYDMVELVDDLGHPIGSAPKLDVHHSGELHRAISIFVFNSEGKQLIQQRALSKYHSPGLWSNACCSHPFPGESPLEAAHRRLQEEIGLTATITPAFVMRYHAHVGVDLVEHEYDHVFLGITESDPVLNPVEVEEFSWIEVEDLKTALLQNPDRFTAWFKLGLERVYEEMGVVFECSTLSEKGPFDRVDFLSIS